MVQEYFVERVRAVERLANERRAALHTKEDAEAYVREVRAKIQQCFGPWPEKSSLNARTTGVVERDVYLIEKVIFESRPNFPVTANLYLRKDAPAPHQAWSGRADTRRVQGGGSVSVVRAGAGAAGLRLPDLRSHRPGRAVQYLTSDLKPRHGGPVGEHLYAGNQQFLVGDFFGAWRAWMASAHSTTCSRGPRSTRGTSASPATPAAAR